MNKIRRNLIKIRSCAIFSLFRFSSYFKVDKRPISCWCDCSSSGSQIFGGQIVHINEGKSKLALFSTKDNAFYLPISLFILTFLLLHNFINVPPQLFYSLSTILIFPHLLLILFLSSPFTIFIIFPPQSSFPSSSTILLFSLLHLHLLIYSIYFSIHKYIVLLLTLHRPHIDPTSTQHRPNIDPRLNFFSTQLGE